MQITYIQLNNISVSYSTLTIVFSMLQDNAKLIWGKYMFTIHRSLVVLVFAQ